MSVILDLTDRQKAILHVALMAMADDETPFDIGEGFEPAERDEVVTVHDLLQSASGLV